MALAPPTPLPPSFHDASWHDPVLPILLLCSLLFARASRFHRKLVTEMHSHSCSSRHALIAGSMRSNFERLGYRQQCTALSMHARSGRQALDVARKQDFESLQSTAWRTWKSWCAPWQLAPVLTQVGSVGWERFVDSSMY
jgi:hypothetical protein